MHSLLFANKFEDHNDRIPFFHTDFYDTTIEIFLPNATFWSQTVALLFLSELFVVLIASIVYHGIIKYRCGATTTTVGPYLIGFGIVCPLCLIFPFWIMNFFEIKNTILRFATCSLPPITCLFHCTEAMFGFSPHSVETSFEKYVLYYISIVEIVFDKKTNEVVKSTKADISSAAKSVVYSILIIGAYQSILRHVQYQPFESDINANTSSFFGLELFYGIFDWRLIINNLMITILLQIYLSFFYSSLCLLAMVFLGVKTCAAMNNPITMTTSVSDFWGKRWNLNIHGCLKRGVFKPVYKYSNKYIAVWSTFIASGLFHEYINIGICPACLPYFGKSIAFFIWNAIMITLEHFVGNSSIFQWIKIKMPKPVVTVLVLSTAMPIAHWFLHPYTKGHYFNHAELLVPIIGII